jgi:hypothetical protein
MSRALKQTKELENTFIDERVTVLLPKFEVLAPYGRKERENGVRSEGFEGWKKLAANQAAMLKARYPDNKPEAERTYNICLRQITALKKALRVAAKTRLKDHANYHPVLTIITHFGNALSFLFSPYKSLQNETYREVVDIRSTPENRVELDLSPFLKLAYEVLIQVRDGATKTDVNWRDVSCALSLVTGRRMGEVHLSGFFRQTGSYELAFQGQLRGKSRKLKVKGQDGSIKQVALRDFEFTIPSLVPAELVVKGVHWLEGNGKRFSRDEDPERVNRTYSKVLSEKVKEWAIVPEGMTYHKFRAAYFRACVQNSNIDPFDWEDYARAILGDDDSATIKAYKRFVIKPGSITKI